MQSSPVSAEPEATPEQEQAAKRLRIMVAMVVVWADRHPDQIQAAVNEQVPNPFKRLAPALLSKSLSNLHETVQSLSPQQIDTYRQFVNGLSRVLDADEPEWQAWYEQTAKHL